MLHTFLVAVAPGKSRMARAAPTFSIVERTAGSARMGPHWLAEDARRRGLTRENSVNGPQVMMNERREET